LNAKINHFIERQTLIIIFIQLLAMKRDYTIKLPLRNKNKTRFLKKEILIQYHNQDVKKALPNHGKAYNKHIFQYVIYITSFFMKMSLTL